MVGLCLDHYLIEILNGSIPLKNQLAIGSNTLIQKKYGIGKIYEVDLEYPDELHHLHNDYPCAAEKIKVTDEMLSDYCKRIKKKKSKLVVEMFIS